MQPLPNDVTYDDMLFVKQLLAARHTELNGAKRQFFNFDLIAREMADKGVKEEIAALENCSAEVHSLWENCFNDLCRRSQGDELPDLHPRVMDDIKALHNARHPCVLPLSLVHRLGAMQQVVENGDAGWVRSFREIASDHARRS